MVFSDTTKEDFLREAPKGWFDLRRRYEQGYSSDCVLLYGAPTEDAVLVTPKNSTTTSYEHKLLGQMEVFNSIRHDVEILECVGKTYAFALGRGRDRDDERWAMRSFADDPARMKIEKLGILRGSIGIFEGIMVEGAWIESLISSGDFKILSIEVDLLDDQQVHKIVFRSNYDIDGHDRILSGTLWFNCDGFWTLSQYQVELQSDTLGTATKRFHYHVLDGVPYPKKIILDYKFERDPPIRYVTSYQSITNTCDPSVFRLSHYGFSEPVEPSQWGNIARIVSMVIGILLILFGLYLRYLAKRS